MRNGAKREKTMELERDTPSPLQDILMPEKIISRSQEAISKATTLSEAMPELSLIAKEKGWNLNITREFLKAKDLMDRRNLSR